MVAMLDYRSNETLLNKNRFWFLEERNVLFLPSSMAAIQTLYIHLSS